MSTNDCICCEIRGRLDEIGEINGAVQLPCVIPTPGEFTENGTYTAPKGYAYNPVVVETFEPTGSVELTENGVYDVTEYAEAEVNVPQPSGSISIVENGSVDVADYETANVNVQPPLEQKTVTPTKQTQNVEPTAPNYGLSKVTVEPIPNEYIVPSGTKQIDIVQNGIVTEDVADYANAEITTNVPQMQRSILRPDAELVETWSYDKLWIEDEGNTLPAYSTTQQVLKTSEQLDVTHEWDLDNYKYLVLIRGLTIPIYNTDRIARGRPEWSSSNAAFEFIHSAAEAFHALADPTKAYDSTVAGWNPAGYMCYRMPYFTNTAGIVSVYSGTGFGIWVNMAQPTYTSGVLHINSPSFTLRCQANILDQPFYEALDDIRFQWVIELWREPIGSLNYNGWVANQELDHILECVYSADHKLT